MVGTVIVQDNSTGLNESLNSIASLNHNQISNTININLTKDVINPHLELYNIEGKLIQNNKIETKAGDYNYEIPVITSLNKGIYIVIISYNQQKVSRKLIVN